MTERITYPPGSPLETLTAARPVLVVFLRHFGCTFCREALADVATRRQALDESGTPICFVHLTEPADAERWFQQAGLGDVPRIADPERAHFRAFGLETTGVATLLSPRVWARGAVCALEHGFGPQPGPAMRQLPGAFVVHGDLVLAGFRHQSPADCPDYLALVAAARTGVTMP